MVSVVRRTRRTVPPEHMDLATWQMPSLDDLDEGARRRFHSLSEAVATYVDGGVISKYLEARGIHRELFYRAFDKCLTLDERGKPFGWLGLLPYIEVKPRQRTAPIEVPAGSKGGLSGALQMFLRANKDIRAALHAYLNTNAKRKPEGEAGIRHKSVHMEFLRLCKENDPEQASWPFTAARRAAGAIRAFVCQYIRCNYDRIVATQFGDKAATKSKAGNGHESRLIACMPFDIVELDEHTAGFIGSVKIETPEGTRIVDAGRTTILLIADRLKGWILGFKVIFRDAANSGDVLDVLHAATVGEPGYAHRKSDEVPTRPLVDLDERFGWCSFNCLLLDNALIHLAEEVVARTRALCGCSVNFGPVHTPARRQLVERIFGELERAGFKRLRTTTGSGPLDPKRQNPEKEARGSTLAENEIVQIVARLVNKHNTNIGKQNLAASAYQRMSSLIAGEERGQYLFPFLPPLHVGEPDLSKLIVRVQVKGKERTGRRPYFSFLEADYTSTEMAKAWDLVDEWIVLHVDRANIRKIPAFHGGKPIGTCMAGGRWRFSDHSMDLRQYINKLLREGYIKNDFDDDVIAEFAKKVGNDTKSKKPSQKTTKSSVRQLADHSVRRNEETQSDQDAAAQDAENAVNELLSRASEGSQSKYMQWEDIGAFNGDGHGN